MRCKNWLKVREWRVFFSPHQGSFTFQQRPILCCVQSQDWGAHRRWPEGAGCWERFMATGAHTSTAGPSKNYMLAYWHPGFLQRGCLQSEDTMLKMVFREIKRIQRNIFGGRYIQRGSCNWPVGDLQSDVCNAEKPQRDSQLWFMGKKKHI